MALFHHTFVSDQFPFNYPKNVKRFLRTTFDTRKKICWRRRRQKKVIISKKSSQKKFLPPPIHIVPSDKCCHAIGRK